MEQYTDDERVEDLKKWWSENGASIIIGIALGVAAIFGWRYWNAYRDSQAEQASLSYDAFIHAVEKPDIDQARQRGQGLLAEFPDSSYAALTALRLAKLAVDRGDNAIAIQRLQWVIANAKLVEFQDIARLRLARVFFTAGQLSDAEKLLDSITISSLSAEVEELRGDLYVAGNDPAKARTAYTAALAAGGENRLLRIKLDNLTAPTADTVIAAPAPPPPIAEAPPVPETTPVEPSPPARLPLAGEESERLAPSQPTPEPVTPEPAAGEPTPEPVAAEPAAGEPTPEPAPPVEPTPEPAPVEPAPTSSPASTSGPPS